MTNLPPSPVATFSSAVPLAPAPIGAPVYSRPANLVGLLEDSVRVHGSSELFVEKRNGRWTPLTYAGLGHLVDELRAGLAQLGVKRGDRVGIIAGNCSEWAVAAYATYSLGAALVPMYETQQAKDWTFIARDAGVSVLFVSTPAIAAQMAARAAELPALRALVLLDGPIPTASPPLRHESFASLRDLGSGQPLSALHPAPSDTACLMYTSGTTGDPKGVVLSHDNIVSNVVGLRSVIPLERRHRTLSFLPWAHALGHTVELHMLIACGASAGIAESVEQLVANFSEVRPTVLVAVPRVFQKIYAGVEKLMATKPAPLRWLYRGGLQRAVARSRGQQLSLGDRLLLGLCDRLVFTKIRARFGGRLQFAVSGAAALAREVAEFVEALGIDVYEGYGLTETSPVVSANVPGCKRLGSVGRPLPGVRVVIDKTASSDQGGDGEIVVYGPNVMVGYHNHPEETRAMMSADGGLRTGDLGYLDADGFLFITGRIKELYKLQNGKYVAPAPLEERLKLSPLVANVMIHGANRPCNVALVVPDLVNGRAAIGDASADLATLAASETLRTQLRAEIARLSEGWKGYERVRTFAVLSEDFTLEGGFLTPSLKLKRRAVLARFGDRLEQLYREVGADGDD